MAYPPRPPVFAYEEVLGNGTCGEICRDMSEWRTAFERITRDRDVLAGWSRRARKAMEPYSTERIAEQYAAFLRALLEG